MENPTLPSPIAYGGAAPAEAEELQSDVRAVVRYTSKGRKASDDSLAVEEPLQIRLAGEDVVVTMRTPGHDEELAAGFLFTEKIIAGAHHIESLGHCADETGDLSPNIVNVQPTERGLLEPGKWGRNFFATSSCGLCGKISIEQVTAGTPGKGFGSDRQDRGASSLRVSLQTLYGVEAKLRAAQRTFHKTGGLHAAGLFTLGGELVVAREDVGRHNAVDKVIGFALLSGIESLHEHILVVSSRASFEILQKAVQAGIPVVAAVSAPSTLAVDLAQEAGITLVGFLRDGRLNVYSGESRIEP